MIEKVDAVLDEDSAALGPVPEPMRGRQVLVRGIVLKVTVQRLAQDFRLDQAAHRFVDRIVPLHQIGHEQPVALTGGRDHGRRPVRPSLPAVSRR